MKDSGDHTISFNHIWMKIKKQSKKYGGKVQCINKSTDIAKVLR
jgi:hypothetical protein